jgi:hypothetical protein
MRLMNSPGANMVFGMVLSGDGAPDVKLRGELFAMTP